jgi:hypothetical protein
VGRWATGRSLLANRRSYACTWSVLGCRPGKTLPMLIVPAYAPTGADGAAERKGGARGRRRAEEAHPSRAARARG